VTRRIDGPILGVSADYHDAAAAVVVDGAIVAAAHEERFSRRKHDPELPKQAIAWCLEEAGIAPGELAAAAYHGKPFSTYERILRTHARIGPRGLPSLVAAMRSWTGRKLWIGYRIERHLRALGHGTVPVRYVEHHLGHAASAFHPSPFERAAVLTADGVGEWATTTIGRGGPAGVDLLEEVRYPHSLGLLYSTVTAHCGFEVNDGEAKLMGLAPYGVPRYEAVIRERLIDLRDDGSFRLDLRSFDFDAGRRMGHPRLDALFDGPPRSPDAPLTEREADLARSVQVVLDDAMLALARRAHALTGEAALVLAGGVALNCVTNGRLLDRGPFDDLWVQPAAGDAGGALGAALWLDAASSGRRVPPVGGDGMRGAALGRSFADDEIERWLRTTGVEFDRQHDDHDLAAAAAADLAAGRVIGWFQGAAEFGPRALGRRSILADPRDPGSVTRINAAIKRREGFRPLAPAVLAERAADLFVRGSASPYMLLTDQVRGAVGPAQLQLGGDGPSAAELLASVESPIPACTHVDGSARVQTVDATQAPRFRLLLEHFDRLTACPAVVNTSFNVAGEPLVDTPADAVRCALDAGLDALYLGRCRVDAGALRSLAGEAPADAAAPVGEPRRR
jgi:carbamoyltransferase